jgi:SAM-dependent methyltransferase
MQNKKLNSIPNFSEEYWEKMYAPEKDVIIDGQDNSVQHANYLKSSFDLAGIQIDSIVDIGCGKGILLNAMLKKFSTKHIHAYEPSQFMYEFLKTRKWYFQAKPSIYNLGLQDIQFKRTFDLGICNSIFQYIPDSEVSACFKKLASSIRYLYFAVPTTEDYKVMKSDVHFQDKDAKSREKKFYLEKLSPYFSIISMNILESKILVKDSNFTFELYRF